MTRSTTLHDLVESKIDQQWAQWSQTHPHLAEAIDRTRLIESAVDRLRDDPDFREAMRQANLDEAKLAAADSILTYAERWIHRLMPL